MDEKYLNKATAFLDRVIKKLQDIHPGIRFQPEAYLIYTMVFALLFEEIDKCKKEH
jgi:hypothetical protein